MLRRQWVVLMLLLVTLANAGTTARAAETSPASTAGSSIYTALRQKLPDPPPGLMDAAQKLYQSDVLPLISGDIERRTPTGGSTRKSSFLPTYAEFQSAAIVGPIPIMYYLDGLPLTKASQVYGRFEPKEEWGFLALNGDKAIAVFSLRQDAEGFALSSVDTSFTAYTVYACYRLLGIGDITATLLLNPGTDWIVLDPKGRAAVDGYRHALTTDQLAAAIVKQFNGWRTSNQAITGDLAEYLAVHGPEILALNAEQPATAQTTPVAKPAQPMWLWLPVGFLVGAAAGVAAGWLMRVRRRSASF